MRVRRIGRLGAVLALLVALVGLGAGPADAAPWGSTGADYDGVLCRLGTTDVPLGAWTVNGTVRTYSLADIAGSGPVTQPAPVSGTPSTMVPGQGNYSQADIAAVAYLISHHGDASSVERAETSASVAAVAGGGGLQASCLGQGGTSAQRAAARLDEARRYAGPYTVTVAAPPNVIPGDIATIAATVRSATGAGVPGLQVRVAGAGQETTAVTGADGVARAQLSVPAGGTGSTASTVTAAVSEPIGLLYFTTTPTSVAVGPPTTVTATATLQPVLHPRPAVAVDTADLLLADGTLAPVVTVTGTFGYSGEGTVDVLGPVQPSSGRSCATLAAGAFPGDRAAWQGSFTFTADGPQRPGTTSELAPGCYSVRASVATTTSSPPERASTAFDPARTVTVSSLTLQTSAAARVSGPGALRATVVGTDPGRAEVSTTVTARGPRPFRDGACERTDWASAPVAATSAPVALRRAGSQLTATAQVPSVRTAGCYSLTSSTVVTLDGRTVTITTKPGADGATTAVLRPTITLAAAAPSGEQGSAMSGTVVVAGSFAYPGVLSVGLVRGEGVPITGCGDATFPTDPVAGDETRLRTTGDDTYRFRTPVADGNACYAVVASFTLDGSDGVAARSAAPSADTVFLAGVRPVAKAGTTVRGPDAGGSLRALITYGVFGLLILAGCVALFVRTLRDARAELDEPLWTWQPDRLPDAMSRRPLPGPRLSG